MKKAAPTHCHWFRCTNCSQEPAHILKIPLPATHQLSTTANAHPHWRDWECTRHLQPAPSSYVGKPPTHTPSNSTIVSSPTACFCTTFLHWNSSHTISSTQITPNLPVKRSPRILHTLKTSLLTKKTRNPPPPTFHVLPFFSFFAFLSVCSLLFLSDHHTHRSSLSAPTKQIAPSRYGCRRLRVRRSHQWLFSHLHPPYYPPRTQTTRPIAPRPPWRCRHLTERDPFLLKMLRRYKLLFIKKFIHGPPFHTDRHPVSFLLNSGRFFSPALPIYNIRETYLPHSTPVVSYSLWTCEMTPSSAGKKSKTLYAAKPWKLLWLTPGWDCATNPNPLESQPLDCLARPQLDNAADSLPNSSKANTSGPFIDGAEECHRASGPAMFSSNPASTKTLPWTTVPTSPSSRRASTYWAWHPDLSTWRAYGKVPVR